MASLETYFKGLADLTRLRIINLLQAGELCGADIQLVLESPQSNVSRHLTYLKRCNLVLDRRSGSSGRMQHLRTGRGCRSGENRAGELL